MGIKNINDGAGSFLRKPKNEGFISAQLVWKSNKLICTYVSSLNV